MTKGKPFLQRFDRFQCGKSSEESQSSTEESYTTDECQGWKTREETGENSKEYSESCAKEEHTTLRCCSSCFCLFEYRFYQININ